MSIDLFQQKSETSDRDRQLGDAKATMDKYLRDYDALFTRTQKVISRNPLGVTALFYEVCSLP